MTEDKWKSVSVPSGLCDEVAEYVKKDSSYNSVSDFFKDAARRLLKEKKEAA